MMKCVICKHGETEAGRTTVTLERGQTVVVFRNVPAQVCANCGEAYVSEEITAQLLEEAEEAVQARVQVDVREVAPSPA
ncbi:MAG: type II toxin-antitoxin system MqsA family antitoxin [Chloroflexota bacterium]|nr:type II toxin-antitoxin system MqsA family antitoxin [Chloroflexota bacterium]